MFDLFLSELRRFRRFTLAAALGHLLALLWGHFNNVHVFELSGENQNALMILYVGPALMLAAVQLLGFQSQQRWQWLMHRPLPRPALFGALALAAAAQIVFVIGLPLLLAALGTDFLTFRTIDMRHYLWIIFVVEIGIIAWLVGATISFSARWSSLMVAILPGVLLMHQSTALAAVLLAGAVLLVYAGTAFHHFKPDRKAPPSGLPANFMVALPLVPAIFIVLMVLWVLLFSAHYKFTVKKPVRQQTTNESVDAIAGMESAKRMKYMVAKTNDPRRADWTSELEAAPVYPVFSRLKGFAKRQQLLNFYTPRPYVTPLRVRWTFDHDDMLFVGIDADTGEFRERRGLHGKGDLTPFPAVPFAGLDYLVTPQSVHAFDAQAMSYPVRAVLKAPEKVDSEPKRIGRRFYMRSDQRLIVYHADRLDADGQFVELFSIPLPSQLVTKVWIDVAPFDSGTLVMVGGNTNQNIINPSSVSRLYWADRYGQVTLVKEHRQAIPAEETLSFKNVVMMLSPAVNAVALAITPITSDQGSEAIWERVSRRTSGPAGWIALALSLSAGLAAWLWLRRGSRRTALGWSAACLLLGLPALLAMMTLHPRQRKLAQN
jgi:hypothetical protein